MVDESAVDRDQLEPFYMTLGEQQPVEGISGGRFGIDGLEDVCDIYSQNPQPTRSQVCRDVRQRHARIQLPKPAFDRNFPKSGHTDEASHISNREMLADIRKLLIEIPPQKGENDMGIKQHARH
jgi:hypothetical protein